MLSAHNESETRSGERDSRTMGLPNEAHLESVTQKATKFVSGPWGTITLFGTLAAWAIAIPFVGWSRAYQSIDQFITVASFILLFLIQRSQSKGMLSLQVKLNELLAAAHRASHELINVEDRSESEVREIHDRFQDIQQRGPGAHSIADINPGEPASR
jgi:low affinity Fe/Cu permease